MRIEEIVVADDTPATPIADGQGTNTEIPGSASEGGAGDPTLLDNTAAVVAIPGSGAEGGAGDTAGAPAADPIDKEMQVPIDDAELNKDLEEVEGEYGPPAEAIEEAGDSLIEARDEEETAHEEIVALESYFLLTKQILDNKTYSAESLQLIRTGVEKYMKPSKLGGLAMEGRQGASIELEHQLVLEGIKESIKSALHSVHTAQSSINDNIKMIFTSIEGDVKRYTAGLIKAQGKFTEAMKANPKQELHLDLHILENFFNLKKTHGPAITGYLEKDEKFDYYVLTQFSTACEKQLESLTGIFGNSKSFSEMLGKVEKLKHPIELFDSKWLSSSKQYEGVLLGGWYAYISQFKVGGYKREKFEKLSRLEQLSSSAAVAITQDGGNAYRAYSTSNNSISFAVSGAMSPVVQVTPAQVKDIADVAVQYLKNIEFFLQVLKSTARTHEMAVEKYQKFEAEDVNRKQADQVFTYLKALEDGVTGTCRHEVTRALKAVFYCIALINRATFVNK